MSYQKYLFSNHLFTRWNHILSIFSEKCTLIFFTNIFIQNGIETGDGWFEIKSESECECSFSDLEEPDSDYSAGSYPLMSVWNLFGTFDSVTSFRGCISLGLRDIRQLFHTRTMS